MAATADPFSYQAELNPRRRCQDTENIGGILMRLLWKRNARSIEPIWPVCTEALELETAKEILVDVFHTSPNQVEETMLRRPEESDWCGEGLGPATFCLGE